MAYRQRVGSTTYAFSDLKTLMAKATPPRSGDRLAGIAAETAAENVAAKMALAELTLADIVSSPLIPYEADEVTRLILDRHDERTLKPVAGMSLGAFRDHLLSPECDTIALAALAPGITPEIAAAISKLMRNQDLIAVARKCSVVTRFRDTIGLPGRLAVRLQPNHPTDDRAGIMASVLDGLMYGAGDAVIGINPASDSVQVIGDLVRLLDGLIARYEIPTQSCVLTHVTTSIALIEAGAPVDLVFQSVAGTETANASFGVTLGLLQEALEAGRSLGRGTIGDNVMYFETGQGSALSAQAHHGVDQQTLEARAYAVARAFEPLLVNTVVGFIGP
jgi:ethanolamine ammonia-lyase large subunit